MMELELELNEVAIALNLTPKRTKQLLSAWDIQAPYTVRTIEQLKDYLDTENKVVAIAEVETDAIVETTTPSVAENPAIPENPTIALDNLTESLPALLNTLVDSKRALGHHIGRMGDAAFWQGYTAANQQSTKSIQEAFKTTASGIEQLGNAVDELATKPSAAIELNPDKLFQELGL